MFKWFQKLLPKEDAFFELADQHAAILVEGARALRALLDGGPDVAACCARIVKLETDADAITREVLQDVKRSFIMPFERGDIQELITAMDDAIDQMRKTTKLVTLYELNSFEPHMREMADVAMKAATLTAEMIHAMRNMGEHAHRIGALAEEIVYAENAADDLHEKGLKELYQRHRNGDAMSFIVGTKIYDSLEKIMDRFEDVANDVRGILIAHL
jgi:predicted phosphate transport protein (TIGR00153 family)